MAIVVTGGRLATIAAGAPPAIPSSIQITDQVYSDLAAIYRSQPQVRTVIGFLARNIAQLGLHTFRRRDVDDRERLIEHPLAKLLKQPAPGKKLTRYQLIQRLVSDVGIYDQAYWVKARDRGTGEVLGVVPVPVARVAPLGDGWISPDGYRVTGARGQVEIPADDVVHFHGYNPDDLRVGLSPLEALRSVLQEEFQASLHRQQLWRNGARTSGFIQRPAGANWSAEARARFKTEFRAVYSGVGPGAGGVPILEDGMTYVAAGLDPKAAQYIEGRKLTREEVAAAYFIPGPLIGILDHATFSNIREQHKQLYQDTLGPWLAQIQEDIALQLLPDLDPDGDVYCEFNIAEKLSGSFEEQAAQLQTSVGAPWMTRNEARGRMNLPAIDGGDELITPLNVLVGGQASPRDSAPDALPAAPDGGAQPASEEDT